VLWLGLEFHSVFFTFLSFFLLCTCTCHACWCDLHVITRVQVIRVQDASEIFKLAMHIIFLSPLCMFLLKTSSFSLSGLYVMVLMQFIACSHIYFTFAGSYDVRSLIFIWLQKFP